MWPLAAGLVQAAALGRDPRLDALRLAHARRLHCGPAPVHDASRHETLGYSLGLLPSYVAPAGASLALTDSMPWFSVLLLPASPLLGDVFQHAGLWLALSYGLLALFSFRVFRFLTGETRASVVAGAVVVANPVLLGRKMHLALCAHWLIVAALFLYLKSCSREGDRGFRPKAALLVLLASGTHPYLAAMVVAILAAAAWASRRSPASAVASVALFFAAAALGSYSFGYFIGAETVASGFGTYSANLLALVDPNGWSRLLPDLPSAPGQYEGFVYPGMATFLAATFAGLAIARRAWRGEPLLARRPPELRLGVLLFVVAA